MEGLKITWVEQPQTLEDELEEELFFIEMNMSCLKKAEMVFNHKLIVFLIFYHMINITFYLIKSSTEKIMYFYNRDIMFHLL